MKYCTKKTISNNRKLSSYYSGGLNIEHVWILNGPMLNGSDFEWHSKTEHHDHSRSNQVATFLGSYVSVPFSNGPDYSYVPDHSNTKPSHTQTSQLWISNLFRSRRIQLQADTSSSTYLYRDAGYVPQIQGGSYRSLSSPPGIMDT